MKRKILIPIILMAVMSAFTLSGCNSEEKESEETVAGFDIFALPEEKATNEGEMWSILPKIDVTPIEELEFDYSGEYGGIAITGYTGKSYKVRIPKVINDEPVVSVNLKGTVVTELIVPDTVKYINVTKDYIKYINYPAGVYVEGEKEGYKNLEGLYLCSNYFSSSLVKESSNPVIIHNGKKYTKENLFDIDKYLMPYRIDDGCLMNCYDSLTEFDIPSDVTRIADKAFKGCETLTSITIPDSVEEIGNNAFADCTGLTSITIGSGIEDLGDNAFKNCEAVTQLTYNSDLQFSYNSYCKDLFPNLETLVIGDEITEIFSSSFSDCEKLTNVTISNSVEKIGNSAFSGCTSLSAITIPNSVKEIDISAFAECTSLKTITIPNTVTILGGSVFRGCTGLTNITIPDSVTYIGDGAFENCTNITNIKVGKGITKLGENIISSCTALKSITYNSTGFVKMLYSGYSDGLADILAKVETVVIGDNVTEIKENEFSDFKKMTSATIPKSVTNIGAYAFSNCESLKTVAISDGVVKIGNGTFSNCTALTTITIPSTVTEIGNSAFSGCKALTAVTIPDSVTRINYNTFGDCVSLTAITIPESVTEIGDSAFSSCSGITEVTIPSGVTKLSGFNNCTGLTNITIPENVTEISSNAFSGCTGLTKITIPDSVTRIDKNAFSDCTNVTDIEVGNGLTEAVGSNAFANCSGVKNIIYNSVNFASASGGYYGSYTYFSEAFPTLETVTIGEDVTSINDKTFSSCENLTSVTIPSSVTSIGESAFSGCKKLTEIDIPDGVTYIGYRAFSDCIALSAITIPDSVKTIDGYAFDGCSNLTNIEASSVIQKEIEGNRRYYGLNDNISFTKAQTAAQNSAAVTVDYSQTVSLSNGNDVYFSYPKALLQNVFDLDIYLYEYRLANATLDQSQYGSADTYKKVLSKGTCLHKQNSVMMIKGLGLTVWVKNTGAKKHGLDNITIRSFNLGELKSASGNTLNAEYSDLGDVVSQEENDYYAKKVWKIADVADNDAITSYGVGIQNKTTGAMTFITIIRSNNYAADGIPSAEDIVKSVKLSETKPSDYAEIY